METNKDILGAYLAEEKPFKLPKLDNTWSQLYALMQEINDIICSQNYDLNLLVKEYPIRKLWSSCKCYSDNKAIQYFICILEANTSLNFKEVTKLASKLQLQKIIQSMKLGLQNDIQNYLSYSIAYERGIILLHEGKEKVRFDTQKFVDYLSKRVRIISEAVPTGDTKLYIYNYYSGIYEEGINLLKRIIAQLFNTALRNFWNERREKEVIELLKRTAESIKLSELNESHMIFSNVALNLRTLEFEDFSPDIKSTLYSSVKYKKNAKCIRFQQYLDEVTEGDKDLQAVLQEVAGYSLTNSTKAQKAFFLYGNGANGKSIFADVLTNLVSSQNVSSVTLENLSSRFGLQPLLNKKLNISNENELASGIKTGELKSITSGDMVTIDRKNLTQVSVALNCKLVFLINNLPNTSDYSHGFFRRLVIIPFNREFKEEEQDYTLDQQLRNELSGILNWAVEGLKRLVSNEYVFTKCVAIEELTEQYKKQQDPVEMYLKQCMKYCEGARTRKNEILETYRKWLTEQAIPGNGTNSTQIFWKQLEIAMKKNSYTLEYKKIKGYDHVANFDLTFHSQYKTTFKNNC